MKLDSRVSLAALLRHLAESAPRMPIMGEPEFNPAIISLWFGRELATKFWSALNEIRIELVPRYARDTDLLNAFWDELICEVTANPQRFLEWPEALDDLINHFSDCWKRPLSDFEVIYSVHHLAVGQQPISLFGVELFAPTDNALAERAIPKSEVAMWSKDARTQTLVMARVAAATIDIAFDAGRDQVVNAITLMKAAALRGVANRTLTDELLQWKLSGWYLARPATAGQQSGTRTWGFHRQFGPLVDDIGDHVRLGIERLKLELIQDLPEKVRSRVLQSIYWIAHSTTHEADDHKLVDLCTALEILLLPEGHRIMNKGTVIALRYNLLGGDMNPSAVKWMYDRRNDVIHGSPLPVVGPRDTWDLRWICYAVVQSIVRASIELPDKPTLQDVIDTVETEERLTNVIERADKGIYEGLLLPQLVKEAQSRLRRLRSPGM